MAAELNFDDICAWLGFTSGSTFDAHQEHCTIVHGKLRLARDKSRNRIATSAGEDRGLQGIPRANCGKVVASNAYKSDLAKKDMDWSEGPFF
jgi:hypothetical protein